MPKYTGPIYSPSQTVLFSKCPFKWYLHYFMGIRPVALKRNTVAATLGKAFQVAFNVLYMSRDTPTAEQLIESTLFYYDNELVRLQNEVGMVLVAEKEAHEYRGRLAKMVNRMYQQPPVPSNYIIEGVEQNPQANDTALMDLWGRFPSGKPFFWDNKCKISLEKKRIPFIITEYMYSWQMHHYGWSLGEKLGEPVINYFICLAISSPTIHIHVEELALDPERMEMWEVAAFKYWDQIHSLREELVAYRTKHGKLPHGPELYSMVPQATEHWDRWGQCELFDPCMLYKGNVQGLQHQYIQVDGRY